MDFSEVIGQHHLKSHFKNTLANDRVPHAQLFVGAAGSGVLPMAIAYAKEILCGSHEKDSPAYVNTAAKVAKLAHPDLHFVYPVNTNDAVKKHPVSKLFLTDWRSFISKNAYGSLFDWLQELGIENKQGNINVDEAADILKSLSLKSYEGGYKIFIIWMADKMNTACANKILKIVEEPPAKTVMILLTENEEQLISTIRSRCQKVDFPRLAEQEIASYLSVNQGVDDNSARRLAHQAEGDYNKALQLLSDDGTSTVFLEWFVSWVRTAFKAKGNKGAITQLLLWSEQLAGQTRETQKKFLSFCDDTFRQALLINYKSEELVFFPENEYFDLKKFAPFVHQNNIFEISQALQDASYHIERNGNAKIIFSDLSIQLTRLIHRKELV